MSRGAVSSGLIQGSPIVHKLLDKPTAPMEDGLELEGPHSYPENALEIWKKTPNALQWLDSVLNQFVEASGEPPLEPNASQRRHHKLWSDHVHSAMTFLERQNNTQAKKSLLSALREARHFSALSREFESVIVILLLHGGAESQLEEAVKEQVQAAEIISKESPLKALHAYTRIADRFDNLENPADADDCCRAAIKCLESLSSEEKILFDNCYRADLLTASAAFWIKEEGLRRSISLYTESIELRSAYLGDNHPQLIDTMTSLHECLICLGDTSAADELVARMLQIDPNAEAELKEHHGHLYLPKQL